jgi:hypothetical protein
LKKASPTSSKVVGALRFAKKRAEECVTGFKLFQQYKKEKLSRALLLCNNSKINLYSNILVFQSDVELQALYIVFGELHVNFK